MQFIDLKAQQFEIKDKIKLRLEKVLHHGKYINGPEVLELEQKLADYVGCNFCVSCSSGTDALLMPLMAKKDWSRRCCFHNTFYIHSNR